MDTLILVLFIIALVLSIVEIARSLKAPGLLAWAVGLLATGLILARVA